MARDAYLFGNIEKAFCYSVIKGLHLDESKRDSIIKTEFKRIRKAQEPLRSKFFRPRNKYGIEEDRRDRFAIYNSINGEEKLDFSKPDSERIGAGSDRSRIRIEDSMMSNALDFVYRD